MSRIGAIAAATMILLTSGAAVAAKHVVGSGDNAAVVQSLLDCRKVADSADRLACFDKAAAAIASASSSGDLVTIDREQRRAARRQAFGFTLPTLSFLDRGESVSEANHITATAADASQDPYGNWVIRLDDGAVWRQTEPEMLARRPHKGSIVVISKGMMGAFFMTIDGEGAGKAKRQS